MKSLAVLLILSPFLAVSVWMAYDSGSWLAPFKVWGMAIAIVAPPAAGCYLLRKL